MSSLGSDSDTRPVMLSSTAMLEPTMGVELFDAPLISDIIIIIMKMNEIMLSAAAAMMKPTAEASIVLPNPNGLGSFFVVGVVSIVFMCFFVTEKICKSTNYFPIEIFFGTNSSDTLFCPVCINHALRLFVFRIFFVFLYPQFFAPVSFRIFVRHCG